MTSEKKIDHNCPLRRQQVSEKADGIRYLGQWFFFFGLGQFFFFFSFFTHEKMQFVYTVIWIHLFYDEYVFSFQIKIHEVTKIVI